tara:strand:- start:1913 stop:2959 length:1047 start_codon:yes stop_codon:yes gene_type:complete
MPGNYINRALLRAAVLGACGASITFSEQGGLPMWHAGRHQGGSVLEPIVASGRVQRKRSTFRGNTAHGTEEPAADGEAPPAVAASDQAEIAPVQAAGAVGENAAGQAITVSFMDGTERAFKIRANFPARPLSFRYVAEQATSGPDDEAWKPLGCTIGNLKEKLIFEDRGIESGTEKLFVLGGEQPLEDHQLLSGLVDVQNGDNLKLFCLVEERTSIQVVFQMGWDLDGRMQTHLDVRGTGTAQEGNVNQIFNEVMAIPGLAEAVCVYQRDAPGQRAFRRVFQGYATAKDDGAAAIDRFKDSLFTRLHGTDGEDGALGRLQGSWSNVRCSRSGGKLEVTLTPRSVGARG